jgi:hypothetical protein
MMVTRRGNSTDYASKTRPTGNPGLIADRSESALAEAWARARLRDPFDGLYNVLKRKPCPSVDGHDLKDVLGYIFEATDNPAFKRAAEALSEAGLAETGGVREKILRGLRCGSSLDSGKDCHGFSRSRVAAYAGARRMQSWINEGASKAEAARLVASQLGLPNNSEEAISKYKIAWKIYLERCDNDFIGIIDRSKRGIEAHERRKKELYETIIGPILPGVEAEFRTVTKDLEEKYRELMAAIDKE